MVAVNASASVCRYSLVIDLSSEKESSGSMSYSSLLPALQKNR